MVENYLRMDGMWIIWKYLGWWKKWKKKNVESWYLYKINNIIVKLLFLLFFCVRLICLFFLKMLCLFSDFVNCIYYWWVWVMFYWFYFDKVDYCLEVLLLVLDNLSFKLLFLFLFVLFMVMFEKRWNYFCLLLFIYKGYF